MSFNDSHLPGKDQEREKRSNERTHIGQHRGNNTTVHILRDHLFRDIVPMCNHGVFNHVHRNEQRPTTLTAHIFFR